MWPWRTRAVRCQPVSVPGRGNRSHSRIYRNRTRDLRPGSLFGIYDVMKTGDGELTYPVPWATTAESSFVADPAQYRSALQAAGFAVIAELNRRDFAITFFDQFRAKT